jgi:hypothetical protein
VRSAQSYLAKPIFSREEHKLFVESSDPRDVSDLAGENKSRRHV